MHTSRFLYKRSSRPLALTPLSLVLVLAFSSLAQLVSMPSAGATPVSGTGEWTQLTGKGHGTVGDAEAGLRSIVYSGDGSKLFASINGLLYSSSDSGETWTSRQVAVGVNSIRNIQSSSDGRVLTLSGVDGGSAWRSYLSTNAGETWTSILDADPQSIDVALSPSGEYLAYCKPSQIDFNNHCYTSSDDGATWQEIALAAPHLFSSIHLSANNTLIAVGRDASYQYYVFSSSNLGATWSSVPIPFAANSDDQVTSSLSGTTLFMTGVSKDDSQRYPYVSIDSGTTWTKGIVEDPSSYYAQPLISADGNVLIMTGGSGTLYLSTSNGATWTRAFSYSVRNVSIQATISSDGNKLALISDKGVYTSADSGVTWDRKTLEGRRQWSPILTSSDGTKVLAQSALDEYFLSTNRGQTWQQYELPGDADELMVRLINGDVLMMATIDHDTGSVELLFSLNFGTTWITAPTNARGTMFWASQDGHSLVFMDSNKQENQTTFHTSTDYGTTWTTSLVEAYLQGNEAPGTSYISPNGDILVVSTDFDAQNRMVTYASNDYGTTWNEVSIDGGYSTPTLLAISQNGNAALGVVTDSESSVIMPFISRDRGATWSHSAINTPITTSDDLSVNISDNGKVILLLLQDQESGNTRLFVSSDYGTSWTQQEFEGITQYTLSESIRASQNGKIIAIEAYDENDYSHLLISTDYGTTWADRTPDNTNWDGLGDTILSANGSVLVTSSWNEDWSEASAYISTNYGQTWKQYSNPGSPLRSLTLSPDGTHLYTNGRPGHVYSALIDAPVIPEVPPAPTLGFTPSDDTAASTPASTDSAHPQPITNTKPTFSGTAAPGSTVTITVHSDPITCTTTANGSGDWSCVLPSNIPPGVHTIIVEVTDPDTLEVTTVGPYYVQVAGSGSTVVDNTTIPGVPNTGRALPSPSAASESLNFMALLIALITVVGLSRTRLLYSKQQ